MTPQHRIHAGVLQDLTEALDNLNHQAPEQVTRLHLAFNVARNSLRSHPLAHATLYEDYRRVVLVPFKYLLVYTTDGQSTDILALLHGARDPHTLEDELTARTFT